MTDPAPRKLRAVFLSDTHMGCGRADIAALNGFLAAHEFEHLYLVGDIVDGWKLEQRWFWNHDCTDFLDLLGDLRRKRVRITLLTGNHDEKLRDVLSILSRPVLQRRYGIRVEERVTHVAADGRRYLVMHGDQFDGAILRGTSKMADRLYSWLTEHALIRPRAEMTIEGGRRRRWSLGEAIARNSNSLLGRYNAAACHRATEDGFDGIVFGHSHVPLVEQRKGRILANCGSWTKKPGLADRHTAVAEGADGRLELIHWPQRRGPPAPAAQVAVPLAEVVARRPETAELVRLIHSLWSGQEAPGQRRRPARSQVAAPAAPPERAAGDPPLEGPVGTPLAAPPVRPSGRTVA